MRKMILLASVLVLAACDASKEQLQTELATAQRLSADKDSLLKDVQESSQLISELNAAIDKVHSLKGNAVRASNTGEMTASPSEQRGAVMARVQTVTTLLNQTESRLANSRMRMADLARKDSTMKLQLAAYDSTISAFQAIIDNQKAEVATLTQKVLDMTQENTRLRADSTTLTSENVQVTADRDSLTTELNRVYYIVGTKEDLLRRHIIEQSGGFLGIGKTQVPARELNPADFTAADKTKVDEIAMPKAGTPYKIITRQDATALAEVPDKV